MSVRMLWINFGLFSSATMHQGCAGANDKASPPGRHQEHAPKQRCNFSPTTFSSVQFSSVLRLLNVVELKVQRCLGAYARCSWVFAWTLLGIISFFRSVHSNVTQSSVQCNCTTTMTISGTTTATNTRTDVDRHIDDGHLLPPSTDTRDQRQNVKHRDQRTANDHARCLGTALRQLLP